MPRTSHDAAIAHALIVPEPKLAPPKHLRPEAAALWRDVVNRLPASQIGPDNAGLLELYIRHLLYAQRLAAQIEKLLKARASLSATKLNALGKLLRLHAVESRSAGTAAVRLGLGQAPRWRPVTERVWPP
jgi:hypothetical protein